METAKSEVVYLICFPTGAGPLQYFGPSSLKILVSGWTAAWIFMSKARFPHWCVNHCGFILAVGKGLLHWVRIWPRVIHSLRGCSLC